MSSLFPSLDSICSCDSSVLIPQSSSIISILSFPFPPLFSFLTLSSSFFSSFTLLYPSFSSFTPLSFFFSSFTPFISPFPSLPLFSLLFLLYLLFSLLFLLYPTLYPFPPSTPPFLSPFPPLLTLAVSLPRLHSTFPLISSP